MMDCDCLQLSTIRALTPMIFLARWCISHIFISFTASWLNKHNRRVDYLIHGGFAKYCKVLSLVLSCTIRHIQSTLWYMLYESVVRNPSVYIKRSITDFATRVCESSQRSGAYESTQRRIRLSSISIKTVWKWRRSSLWMNCLRRVPYNYKRVKLLPS